MSKLSTVLISLLIAGIVMMPAAYAADKKDKSAKRAALMMQKMKQDMQAQMEQEKAAMQAQFDVQKQEQESKIKAQDEQLKMLSNAQYRAKKSESELVKLTADKAALETKHEKTEAELATLTKELADLKAKYNQALADLKVNDTQRKTQLANLSDTTQQLNSCEEKNAKLHQYGSELVAIYDTPSSYTKAMRKESFFQLKRVELENILQDQKDKIDEARFQTKKSDN